MLGRIAPEAKWQAAREHHGPYHNHNGAMHLLVLSIAGLVAWLVILTHNSCVLAKEIQSTLFSSAVRSQHINAAIKLTSKKTMKCLNF